MTKNIKLKYIIVLILLAVTLGFSYAVCNFQVDDIGPCGTSVGFSKLNYAFHQLTGPYTENIEEGSMNYYFYIVTQYLGYYGYLVMLIFASMGLTQWIKRKNMFKVDIEILSYGLALFSIFVLYFVFDQFPLNFRPVIMTGETMPESSFPSSHTMVAIVATIGAVRIISKYVNSVIRARIFKIILIILLVVVFVGRVISGVHWITDIIGGLLISSTLLTLEDALICTFNNDDLFYKGAHFKK